MPQAIFNAINENFQWTEDSNGIWYEWNQKAAAKQAKRWRNERKKELKAEGYIVTVFSSANNLMKRGGIGTGKPEIEFYANSYGLNTHGFKKV